MPGAVLARNAYASIQPNPDTYQYQYPSQTAQPMYGYPPSQPRASVPRSLERTQAEEPYQPYNVFQPSTNAEENRRPRCYEHGCNGRQFSTHSNLMRHQRERDGIGSKSYCEYCGAEFTRSTAMRNHVTLGKCRAAPNSAKHRRDSHGGSLSSGSG